MWLLILSLIVLLGGGVCAVQAATLDLAWTYDPAIPVVPPQEGFEILRCAGGRTPQTDCVPAMTVGTVVATARTYTDTALADNARYCYVVYAFRTIDGVHERNIRSTTQCKNTAPAVALFPPVTNLRFLEEAPTTAAPATAAPPTTAPRPGKKSW